jgi:hypothetical protein
MYATETSAIAMASHRATPATNHAATPADAPSTMMPQPNPVRHLRSEAMLI